MSARTRRRAPCRACWPCAPWARGAVRGGEAEGALVDGGRSAFTRCVSKETALRAHCDNVREGEGCTSQISLILTDRYPTARPVLAVFVFEQES